VVGGAGVPALAGTAPAVGSGRTSRYSASVHTNASAMTAVDRRTGSRISARRRGARPAPRVS
jgi:hypothetical protein